MWHQRQVPPPGCSRRSDTRFVCSKLAHPQQVALFYAAQIGPRRGCGFGLGCGCSGCGVVRVR